MSTTVELHRKDAELQAVRAELVALRAGVSALADEWGDSSAGLSLPVAFTYATHTLRLRALLTTDAES